MNRRDRKEGLRGRVVGAEKNTSKLAATKQERERTSRGEHPVKSPGKKKTRLGAGTVCSLVEYVNELDMNQYSSRYQQSVAGGRKRGVLHQCSNPP